MWSQNPFTQLAGSAALAGLILSACGDDGGDPLPDSGVPVKTESLLAAAESESLRLELHTMGPLEVGRNAVAYRLFARPSGTAITRAELSQRPLMTMMNHSHACPFIDPPAEADAAGRFVGTLVPNMPSGAMGKWTLDVVVGLEGETSTHTLSYGELTVSERAIPARKDLVVGEDKYMVTLNFTDGAPAVGESPVIVTVHRVMHMGATFPPVTDFSIVMTPWMPTMGHGSSGNVDPVHTARGEYEGLVNFNMLGAWRITLELSRGPEKLGEVVYDFTL